MDNKSGRAIKIYARQRELLETESDQKCFRSLSNRRELVFKNGITEKKYTLDGTFGKGCSNTDVFNEILKPIIKPVCHGYSNTFIVFGATGSGKTYTMFGELKDIINGCTPAVKEIGIVHKAAEHIFAELIKFDLKVEYTVRVSCVEVYNEEVRDVFNEHLQIRIYDDPCVKGSICFKDVKKITVVGIEEFNNFIHDILKQRFKPSPLAIQQATRTTTIFTIFVDTRETNTKGENIVRSGKIQFVEMAGSEHLDKRFAELKVREVSTMNRSLSTFTKLIKSLSQRLQHIPFRDSKLTRILQDSFGGSSRTQILITYTSLFNTWDDINSHIEIISLAKNIVNMPSPNVSNQDNLMVELNAELVQMKEELSAARQGQGFYITNESYDKLNKDVTEKTETLMRLVKQIRKKENHSASLAIQEKQLNISFNNSRQHLETVRKKLDTVRCDTEKKLEDAKGLKTHYEKLKKELHSLIGDCKATTKNGEIFYEKFQARALNSQDNIGVVQKVFEMLMCALDLERIPKHQPELFFAPLLEVTENIEKSVGAVANAELAFDSDKTEINWTHLLRATETRDMFNQLVGLQRNSMAKFNEIKSKMVETKSQINHLIGDANTTFQDRWNEVITTYCSKRDSYLQQIMTFFEEVESKLPSEIVILSSEFEDDRVQVENVKKEVQKDDASIQKVEDQRCYWLNKLGEIKMQLNSYDTNFDVGEIANECDTIFEKTVDRIENIKSLATDFVDDYNTCEQNLCNLYDNEIHSTEKVVACVPDIDQSLSQQCENKKRILQCFKSAVEKSCTENCNSAVTASLLLKKDFDDNFSNAIDEINKIANFAHNCRLDVKNLYGNVCAIGHVGDTPQKTEKLRKARRSVLSTPVSTIYENDITMFS